MSRPDDLSSVANQVKHPLKGLGLEQCRHRCPHIEFTFLERTVRKRCGVEVAGTAATVGAARVEEAKQAQQTKEQFEQRLDATMQAAQQQREAAEQASQQ